MFSAELQQQKSYDNLCWPVLSLFIQKNFLKTFSKLFLHNHMQIVTKCVMPSHIVTLLANSHMKRG